MNTIFKSQLSIFPNQSVLESSIIIGKSSNHADVLIKVIDDHRLTAFIDIR